jgi:DNA repair exonuclease SbcCD ATPase subunit
MRPIRIYLKNFMNHRLTEVDCTHFQSVLIVGKSKKDARISNGVGKTTIFRAIEYALFNQSHATTLDKVVREGKKKAVVEFDFELAGEIYRIYRHRTSTGSSDVRIYKKIGTEFESISARTPSATDIKLREIIKITHKAFTYSVLFRQADLTGITSVSDPKKRKEVLKEPLNLNTYTKLEEMAVDARRPLKRKIDTLEGSIQIIGNPDTDIEKSEEELQAAEIQIKHNQDIIHINNNIIEQKRANIDDLKQSLDQQDIDIHKKVNEQELALKKLKDNVDSYIYRLLSITNLISTKEIKIQDLTKNQARFLAEVESLSGNYNNKTINELHVEYDKVCNDEVKGSEMIAAIKSQMNITKIFIPDNNECPTCHQNITREYRDQMSSSIRAKLKKSQDDLDFLEDALVKCKRKKTRLSGVLKSERDRLSNIERFEEKVNSISNELKSIREEVQRLYVDQKEVTKKLRDYEQQMHATTEHLKTLQEVAVKSNAIIINKRIFELNKEILDAQCEINSANKYISNFSSMQGGLKERIKTRKDDKTKLVKLKEDLITAQGELKIRQMVVDAFSSRGIPSFIIQTIIDELQFEANVALKELRPELEVYVDSDLNFEYRRNGLVREYEQLSHGQHVYIALAFKRGIARIIQKRLNIDIKLLEFDEVDSNLDEAGVDAFADAIRKWQKDFTIFVITHNKDLKDKFSHAIMVEEGDDGAEAKLVTTW